MTARRVDPAWRTLAYTLAIGFVAICGGTLWMLNRWETQPVFTAPPCTAPRQGKP